MLEVIDRGAGSQSHPIPLLFVHGGWHGAWCWDEHFLDFFADKGYRALAVSVRGHGHSPVSTRPHFCAVTDFVDDVASVADGLPTRPVVIGHSLGGFIVQKYLESHQAPAGVLLASLPPRGIGGFLWRNAKRHPLQAVRATLTTKTLRNYRTPALVREAFYSSATPESDVVRYGARLCEEYTGRVTLDTLILNRPEPERVTSPVLVLGAEADHCITPAEVDATARAYRTIAELFPWMGHNMMLEPDWPKVAGTIHNWLTAHGI